MGFFWGYRFPQKNFPVTVIPQEYFDITVIPSLKTKITKYITVCIFNYFNLNFE